MCVVSFIGNHYQQKWQPYFPDIDQHPPTVGDEQISKLEFDRLKWEVQEMKELLRKAKIYDKQNNEPNCEMEDKMKFLRKVAKSVDINLDDVITLPQ